MKKAILLLTLSMATALQSPAQTTLGAAASPANLGLPGFNNAYGPFFGNQLAGVNTSAKLDQLLLNLQVDLGQILPVVASINDSFDFTTASAFGTTGSAVTGTASG